MVQFLSQEEGRISGGNLQGQRSSLPEQVFTSAPFTRCTPKGAYKQTGETSVFGGVFGRQQVLSLKSENSEALVKLLAPVPAWIQGGSLGGTVDNTHFNTSVL